MCRSFFPTRNKNVKRESYILITTKTNCKSSPAWLICFRLQKEWRMVAFFKQRETCRPDKTRLSECFELRPFIWFNQSKWYHSYQRDFLYYEMVLAPSWWRPLSCRKWTGFYMITAFVMKKLMSLLLYATISITISRFFKIYFKKMLHEPS